MPEIQDPPYKVNQQVLADFSATVKAKPNLTKEELFSKFPEFNNDEKFLQSALDYSSTSLSGKYKSVEELNSKFPEFDFNLEKKNGVGSNGTPKPSNGSAPSTSQSPEGIDVKAEAQKFEKARSGGILSTINQFAKEVAQAGGGESTEPPEQNFAAIENVLTEKRNADIEFTETKRVVKHANVRGIVPLSILNEADEQILNAGVKKKQAEQSEAAVIKANKDKIWEPIAAITSNPNQLENFFKGDVFNHEYANQYFDDYVKKRGGGGYSRTLMVAKMKAAAEWEHDNPRRKKLLEEEYKSKGINIDKYSQQLYDKAVVPLVNRQEEMVADAKVKADSYLEELKPKAAELGAAYKQAHTELQQLFQSGGIPKEEADKKLAEINTKYLQDVKGLDSEYSNQIKSINKSVANKFGRITKEIEVIGKTITDEKVWASIPEADKQKIALSQEAAQKKLEAEKNQTRKTIDKAILGASPTMFVGKVVASGWEQGVADMGDYLSFKGFDNKFVRDLQSQRTTAEELSPAEYTWQKNPFMKAVTSAGVSIGASLPSTGAAIGVTLLSGGLGLPALVTTVAGGLTAWGLETAQNTGGAFRSILDQKQDVSLAISGAREFNEKQDKLIPLYFVSSLGLQNILKGGVKRTIAGTALEVVEEIPTETYQGFTQRQAVGYEGGYIQSIEENPTQLLDILAGTLGQSASMAAAVKAYSTLFKKSPNPEEQFYADMIEKGGVEVAIKNIQQLVENDIISEDEYKIKYANIQSVLSTLGKVKDLGLNGDDAKAFVAYSHNVKDLTRKIANEKNEALKDIYTKKLKEAKNDLTEISQGKGVYAVVTMPGGGNQTFVMPVEEIDDELIQHAEKIEVKNDKLANKDIQKRKAKLGVPEDVPDGMYQEKPLTAAEEKIKSGDMLSVLTSEEKKEWNDLNMAEKLELAKENLPEVSDLSDLDIVKIADTRAKELLAARNIEEPRTEEEILNIMQAPMPQRKTAEVFQPTSEETGEPGSGRKRVESIEQGQEIAGESKEKETLTAAEKKVKDKLVSAFGDLTDTEKKDLSLAEQLERVRENLPEIPDLTKEEVEEADARAKELLEKLHNQPQKTETAPEPKEPIKEGMTDKQQLKFIAQQAQNVQEDGSVSDLQTLKAAYDSAVRNFGSKELVDAAIAVHPLESLVKPTKADVVGGDEEVSGLQHTKSQLKEIAQDEGIDNALSSFKKDLEVKEKRLEELTRYEKGKLPSQKSKSKEVENLNKRIKEVKKDVENLEIIKSEQSQPAKQTDAPAQPKADVPKPGVEGATLDNYEVNDVIIPGGIENESNWQEKLVEKAFSDMGVKPHKEVAGTGTIYYTFEGKGGENIKVRLGNHSKGIWAGREVDANVVYDKNSTPQDLLDILRDKLPDGKIVKESKTTPQPKDDVPKAIKDEKGEPIIFHHGTNAKNVSELSDDTGTGGGQMLGKGYYLTTDAKSTKDFGANTISGQVEAKNPLDLNNYIEKKEYLTDKDIDEKDKADLDREVVSLMNSPQSRGKDGFYWAYEAIAKVHKNIGKYDAVVFKTGDYREVRVTNKSQIKSAQPKADVPIEDKWAEGDILPKDYPRPNEERKFTKRELINPVIRPEAKISIAANLKYVRQTNVLSIDEARRLLDSVGEDQAFDLVVRDKDLKPAVRVVLGQVLILRYNELATNATDQDDIDYYHDKTIDIANFVAEELGTKPGQIIQALSLFERLSPEAQLRAEVKEVKKRAVKKRSKRKKDVDAVTKKFQEANEEAVNEVVASKVVKEKVQKAENQTIKKAKDKIEQARTRRENIIKKYKGEKGKNLFSTVPGLTPEGIEYVGNLAKTYLDEGIANVQIIVEKILDHLKDAAGKDVTDMVTRNVTDVVSDNYERYFGKRIATGLVPFEKDIAGIIKNHYTVTEDQKRSLKDKFVDDADMDFQEATELAAAIEQEFNEIATRKKMDILHNDKMRFERIKNRLQGSKRVTPQQLYENIIKFSNLGAFENEDLMDMIFHELGTESLSKEEIATIISLAKKIQSAPEGNPKSEATEDLLTYRAQLKGVQWGEVSQAVWYAQILSGYLTHIKNIVSTFFSGISLFTVGVARDPRSIPFLVTGAGRGLKRGVVEAWHTIATGRSPIHINKIETPTTLERVNFIGGYLNPFNYLKFVGRMMVAEDVLQFQALKEMKATQFAYREARRLGKKNPLTNKEVWKIVNEKLLNTGERYAEASEEAFEEGFRGIEARRRIYELMERSRPVQMVEESYGFAAKGTFNHEPEGSLGALTNAISVALDVNVNGVKPLRFVIPFTRIITNVANNLLDYSPIGYVRALRKVRGFQTFEGTRFAEQYHEMSDDERKDTIAKASLGIGLTAAIFAISLIKGDDDEPLIEITGNGTGDYRKDAQLRNTGWQAYSIKVGDKYFSYALTPLMFNLAWIGNRNDRKKYDSKFDEEGWIKRFTMSVWQSGQMLSDMTWIGSSADLLKSIASLRPSELADGVERTISNSAKGFIIPNAYTQLAQKIQQINDLPQKEVDNLYEQLIQDIPIARNSLNDKINALGDPVIRDRDLLISSETKDPVWKFLLDKGGWVTPINKNSLIVPDGKKQDEERLATEDEYYEFSKLRGAKIKAAVKDIMENGASLTDEGKVTISEDLTYSNKSAEELTPAQLRSLLKSISGQATKEAKKELFNTED